MDFYATFNEVEPEKKSDLEEAKLSKIQMEIQGLFSRDKKYQQMKAKAKKSSDNVPDFLDYVYNKYEGKIEDLSNKYGLDFDEIAQEFLK
jgi:hypothetical protein